MNATTLRAVETFIIVFFSLFLTNIVATFSASGTVDLTDPLTLQNIGAAVIAAAIGALRRVQVTGSTS